MEVATVPLEPVRFLEVLADDLRWQILVALGRSDHRVQELVDRLEKPMSLISYHLRRLRRMKLVRERRSDADARDVYYGLDLDRLTELYSLTGKSLHPALSVVDVSERRRALTQDTAPMRVLFLCTENSARSQMAEGILRRMGRGLVEVASAGSHPTRVHPLAIEAMTEAGIDISDHWSKSLEKFRGESFDYVITVCDRVKEVCPTYPGDPERIHWSIADPVATEGTEEKKRAAFRQVAAELQTMIRYLVILIERDVNWVA